MMPALDAFAAELRDNPRLRLGLLAITGIVWLYALLLWNDAQTTGRDALRAVQSQADRLRPLERSEALWQERATEARQMVSGLQTYLWESRSRSLAEAEFRDWLQSRAQAAGLTLRELSVRAEEPADSAKGTGSGSTEAGPLHLRARLVGVFAPQSASALLAALHSNPKYVGVQRLVVRNPPAGQDAVLELDLVAGFVIRDRGQ